VKDFWLSCGHHLVDRDASGRLLLTDAFIKAYLARPELMPPPEACQAERGLHAGLLARPRRCVDEGEIAAILDPDARENWAQMIAFRDHLLRHRTLEAAYLDLACRGVGRTPPLFLSHLVQVILRGALEGCDDPFMLRAAELLFRAQRLTVHEGSLIAADEEVIAGASAGPLSPLVSMLGLPAGAGIDVLGGHNVEDYWRRSDAFNMALDLTTSRRGLAALGAVMTSWIRQILAIEVAIEPLAEIRDVVLAWYIGLDATGTEIGNALWNGEAIDDKRRASVVGLYRLTFGNPEIVADAVGREPVYLILAMGPDKVLRMKPQNLLAGLPVRTLEAAT
jgi:hypothetical protein